MKSALGRRASTFLPGLLLLSLLLSAYVAIVLRKDEGSTSGWLKGCAEREGWLKRGLDIQAYVHEEFCIEQHTAARFSTNSTAPHCPIYGRLVHGLQLLSLLLFSIAWTACLDFMAFM